MSKYGYNPDEHFQTKVTLIDKDGFHKESDEVPSGGSSGSGLEEGIYAYEYIAESNGDDCVYLKVIVDCSKRTGTYEENSTYYSFGGPIISCLYFGEKLDESNFRFGNEYIKYGNEPLLDYLDENNIIYIADVINYETRINTNFTIIKGVIESSYYDSNVYNDIVTNIHNNIPAHYVAYYPNHNHTSAFVFIDDIINIGGET